MADRWVRSPPPGAWQCHQALCQAAHMWRAMPDPLRCWPSTRHHPPAVPCARHRGTALPRACYHVLTTTTPVHCGSTCHVPPPSLHSHRGQAEREYTARISFPGPATQCSTAPDDPTQHVVARSLLNLHLPMRHLVFSPLAIDHTDWGGKIQLPPGSEDQGPCSSSPTAPTGLRSEPCVLLNGTEEGASMAIEAAQVSLFFQSPGAICTTYASHTICLAHKSSASAPSLCVTQSHKGFHKVSHVHRSKHWYYLKLNHSLQPLTRVCSNSRFSFPAMFFQNLFQCLCDVLLPLECTTPHSSQLLTFMWKGQSEPRASFQLPQSSAEHRYQQSHLLPIKSLMQCTICSR